MKTRQYRKHLAGCAGSLIAGLAVWGVVLPHAASAHGTTSHMTVMDYAGAKASELAAPLPLTGTQTARLREGARDEDDPVTRSLDHAWNPINNGAFPAGDTAWTTAAARRGSMTAAFAAGNFDGGDEAGAWHFLGRVSHLMQDMTSPLHALAVQHAIPSCQFEAYWDNNDTSLRTSLASIGGPLHSSVLDDKAVEKLDGFSASRLTYRFNNSCPNKDSDDVRGWIEVMAWTSYFRSTIWGQITMGNSVFLQNVNGPASAAMTTATTFSDGTVASKTNALHSMFNGNVRWINNYIGDDYYEITDRNGYVFRFMSFTDVDDWAACGESWANGQQDGSTLVNGSDYDDDGVRVVGRFWFDTRELGRDTSGSFNRYCYPNRYPDGASMTEHLHQSCGNSLYPLTVRYNAGLLGLANRRISVKTADETEAGGFAWSRMDNWGRPATFAAGPAGSNFYFVAKSAVTLTAPATNTAGRAFVRWLRDGAAFSGNANRSITVNDSSFWPPVGGVAYTAEYQAVPPALGFAMSASDFVLTWPANDAAYWLEYATNLPASQWFSNSAPPLLLGGRFAVTNPMSGNFRVYRLRK